MHILQRKSEQPNGIEIMEIPSPKDFYEILMKQFHEFNKQHMYTEQNTSLLSLVKNTPNFLKNTRFFKQLLELFKDGIEDLKRRDEEIERLGDQVEKLLSRIENLESLLLVDNYFYGSPASEGEPEKIPKHEAVAFKTVKTFEDGPLFNMPVVKEHYTTKEGYQNHKAFIVEQELKIKKLNDKKKK